MKPDDRIRVLAPVSGQVAAFAVVLALGLLFGHRTSSPHSPKTPGQSFPLSVTAFEFDQPTAGDPVSVFAARRLRRVGHGETDHYGYFGLRVPPGSYQVCLKIPIGYTIGTSSMGAGQSPVSITPHQPPARTGLPSLLWKCAVAKVSTGPIGMSVEFARPSPPAQPGSPRSSSAYLQSPSGGGLSSERAL